LTPFLRCILRFYIKPNQTPPGEVAFWLHVDVGAADEEAGEEGMAHFIEHMAFNGTKNFSARELDETLRAMGLTTANIKTPSPPLARPLTSSTYPMRIARKSRQRCFVFPTWRSR
jgi:Insulinase (Peptidase family M16)